MFRDEIEQLVDDDGDIVEKYLTKKKRRMESSFYGKQPLNGYSSIGGALSVSTPVSSPPESRRLEKTISFSRNRHESMKSSDTNTKNIE